MSNQVDEKEIKRKIKEYKKKIEQNPQDIESFLMLGSLYLDLRKDKEAIEYCEKALQITPINASQAATAWRILGLTYDLEHRYRQAIDCYEKEFQITPEELEDPGNMGMLADAYLHRALECYRKVDEVCPDPVLTEKIKFLKRTAQVEDLVTFLQENHLLSLTLMLLGLKQGLLWEMNYGIQNWREKLMSWMDFR